MLVLDAGAAEVRAGLAGSHHPAHVFPSVVGASHAGSSPLVGADAEQQASASSSAELRRPMVHGWVEDWDGMERLWHHAFELATGDQPKRPALLAQDLTTSLAAQRKVAEFFFETMGCPAISEASHAVLSLYASGRTTGVVLECGESLTQAVTVYEGFALSSSRECRSKVAGRDVTDYIGVLLRRSGNELQGMNVPRVLRDIKHKLCHILHERGEDEAASKQFSSSSFDLPDGTKLTLGGALSTLRWRAPDVLFRPNAVGSESPGAAELLSAAIGQCEVELRAALFGSIVLSGGSTLLEGFGERTLSELKQGYGDSTKIRISAPPDRAHSPWIGGSIVASLSSFDSLCITKEQYKEYGPTALNGPLDAKGGTLVRRLAPSA